MEIVVELYKGMINNLEQAKNAYEDGNLEEVTRLDARTMDIIAALQSNLDFDAAPDDADYLNRFYSHLFSKLANTLSEENPSEAYDYIIEYVRPTYERWVQLAYQGHAERDETDNEPDYDIRPEDEE